MLREDIRDSMKAWWILNIGKTKFEDAKFETKFEDAKFDSKVKY